MSQVLRTGPALIEYRQKSALVNRFSEITDVGTAVPLLSSLPDFRSIVNQIIGELQDRFPEFTNRWLRIVRAMFSHIRRENSSNRVWPSEEQLALETGTSETLVKRVRRVLKEELSFVPVAAGLYDGPGPHDLDRAEWRNPRGTVPTYDLYYLVARLLPPDYLRALQDLLEANIEPVPPPREYPDPFTEAKNTSGSGEAAPLCNVPIEVEKNPQKRPNENLPSPVVLTEVPRSKSTLVYRNSAGAGVVCLVGIGMWKHVARKIVKQEGDVFAERLAAYARWRERRGELRETKQQYAWGVYRDWGPESAFPDEFRATEEYRSPGLRPPVAAKPQKPKPDAVPSGSPPDRGNSLSRLAELRAMIKQRGKGKPRAS